MQLCTVAFYYAICNLVTQSSRKRVMFLGNIKQCTIIIEGCICFWEGWNHKLWVSLRKKKYILSHLIALIIFFYYYSIQDLFVFSTKEPFRPWNFFSIQTLKSNNLLLFGPFPSDKNLNFFSVCEWWDPASHFEYEICNFAHACIFRNNKTASIILTLLAFPPSSTFLRKEENSLLLLLLHQWLLMLWNTR